MNETWIEACLSKFDNGSYTMIQFLCAVSHSAGTGRHIAVTGRLLHGSSCGMQVRVARVQRGRARFCERCANKNLRIVFPDYRHVCICSCR